MAFVSLAFFIFVAALTLVYFLVPKSFRWAVLLAGSYVFCWLNIRWLALVLLGTTLVTYLIGLWIQRVQDGRKAYMDAHKAEMDREQRKAYKTATKRTTRRILTLGVELELNFRQPYFSSSVEEFWRRWHMTMGNWMRDYVFYPLSMSKVFTTFGQKSRKLLGQYVGKRLPPFCAMFIVYILAGLWHRAAWNYVVFGLWNGVFIMLDILMDGLHDKARRLLRIREETITWRIFRIVRTFVVISIGRYFSRGNSLKDALDMIGCPFKNWRDITFLTNGTLLKLGLDTANWVALAIFLLVLLYVDLVHERDISFREVIDRQDIIFRWLIYIGAVLVILVFGLYGPQYDAASFIYQGF